MKKFGLIQVAAAPVRASDSDTAEIVTQLLFGEAIELITDGNPWVKIRCQHDGYEGYMDTKQIEYLSDSEYTHWKTLPKTRLTQHCIQLQSPDGPEWIFRGAFLPSSSPESGFRLGSRSYEVLHFPKELARNTNSIETAMGYLNTPYLWGGRSVTGIDCSGYTQIVFAFMGVDLLRDASQQATQGETVEFADSKPGDLAFFHNTKGKIIHVGILTGTGTILHASGKVREDQFDQSGIFRKDLNKYTHNLTLIRRYFK